MRWLIGAGSLMTGVLLGIYMAAWQGPSDVNECIMSQVGDMHLIMQSKFYLRYAKKGLVGYE